VDAWKFKARLCLKASLRFPIDTTESAKGPLSVMATELDLDQVGAIFKSVYCSSFSHS
jgi:hypothetical protein